MKPAQKISKNVNYILVHYLNIQIISNDVSTVVYVFSKTIITDFLFFACKIITRSVEDANRFFFPRVKSQSRLGLAWNGPVGGW